MLGHSACNWEDVGSSPTEGELFSASKCNNLQNNYSTLENGAVADTLYPDDKDPRLDID